MTKKTMALRLVPVMALMAGLLTAALPARAQLMFKCVNGGQVTYQQTPCPGTGPVRSLEADRAEAERRHRDRDPRPVAPRPAVAAAAALAAPAGRPPATASATGTPPTTAAPSSLPTAPSRWRCDGRRRCSEMKSCEEAKFFLANCPGVKMDGDHDGVPCEEQWCHSGG